MKFERLDPDERKAQILDVAVEMFMKRPGLDIPPITEIAANAGVVRGLIHHYFDTKRGLYLAVLRQVATPPRITEHVNLNGSVTAQAAQVASWYLGIMADETAWLFDVSQSTGDRDVDEIINKAEQAAASELAAAMGVSQRSEVIAVLKVYIGMVKTTGREWLVRALLNREQAHTSLAACLATIVTTVIPSLNHD